MTGEEQEIVDRASGRVEKILSSTGNPAPAATGNAAVRPVPAEKPPRATRSDKGKPKIPPGQILAKFLIEPESGFALVQWMTREGYADSAAELVIQLGKYYDDLRLSD